MTDRVVTEQAQSMLDLLPPYLADDENVIAAYTATAGEIERLESAGHAFQMKVIPTQADDEFSTLSMWEAVLGLPVAPPSVSVAIRRNFVLARLRSRSVALGSEWFDRISEVLGTGWSYEEGPTDYTISIRVPFTEGGVRIDIHGFIRDITPAHLDILFGFEEGFLMGISEMGDEL